jgi:hypothetical protein
VSWEKFEAIRTMISSNVPTSRHHGAPKHGDALLAGLIRCKRCGRKLTLRYSGMESHIPRYSCSRAWMDNGGAHCIAFGGLRVDDAIEAALLGVVGPGAVAAATAAAKGARERRDQVRDALSRDLEAARYAADRAFRQYDAADPANRLVAIELEARWNRALTHAAEVEAKIAMHDAATPAPLADPASLGVLASNLKTVWDASGISWSCGNSRGLYTPAVRSSRGCPPDEQRLSAWQRASPFLSREIFQGRIVQHGVGQEPLQSCVLVLQGLQPLGLRHLHPAEFCRCWRH